MDDSSSVSKFTAQSAHFRNINEILNSNYIFIVQRKLRELGHHFSRVRLHCSFNSLTQKEKNHDRVYIKDSI